MNGGGAGSEQFRNMFHAGWAPERARWRFPGDAESRRAALGALAERMMTAPDLGETSVEAGYTYLAQLVTHDMGFSLDRAPACPFAALPARLGRRPGASRLLLDILYCEGPETPEAWRRYGEGADALARWRLHAGAVGGGAAPGAAEAARRARLREGAPAGADPGPVSDRNPVFAGLLDLFRAAHNRALARLGARPPGAARFEAARRVTQAAYRRIVFEDLCERLLRRGALEALEARLACGEPLDAFATGADATPVEFSHAVSRFGHALVRADYALGAAVKNGDAIGLHSLLSRTPRQGASGRWAIDWARFFGPAAQRAAAFSPRVTPFLAEAPTLAAPRGPPADRAGLVRADLARSEAPDLAPDHRALSADALAAGIAPLYGGAAQGWLAFDPERRRRATLCWLGGPAGRPVEPPLADLAADPPLLFLTLLEASAPGAQGGGDGRRLGALGSAIFGVLLVAGRAATRAGIEDHPDLAADEAAVWGPGPPPARMTDLIAALAAPDRGEPR
jgi:hypothetical protein